MNKQINTRVRGLKKQQTEIKTQKMTLKQLVSYRIAQNTRISRMIFTQKTCFVKMLNMT